MLVGQEGEGTLAVELNKRGHTGGVFCACIFGGRSGEGGRGVSFNVDDICSGAIIGNEGKLLLNALLLEEGRCLTVSRREGVSTGCGVRLRFRLERGNC